MKIAVFSTLRGTPWGGSEELWAAMARAALAAGHHVAASVQPGPVPKKLSQLQESGIQLIHHRLEGLTRLEFWLWKLKPLHPFRELINFAPDVVCFSLGSTYDLAASASLRCWMDHLQRNAIPYLILIHGHYELHWPGPVVGQVASDMFARAHRVVFFAERHLKNVERDLTRFLPNAVILRNPVNLAESGPLPWPAGSPIRFATVSVLDAAIKGLDLMLEALSDPQWRTRDWQLRIHGEGRDKENLRALAAYYGLSNQVSLCGQAEDIRSVWADSHLLLLPSRSEVAPLTLIEAMLCGRPAVITDVGGVREWVEEPRTAFIAEGATVRSFRSALERAWQARGNWPQMGVSAFDSVREKIDPKAGQTLLHLLLASGRESGSEK